MLVEFIFVFANTTFKRTKIILQCNPSYSGLCDLGMVNNNPKYTFF